MVEIAVEAQSHRGVTPGHKALCPVSTGIARKLYLQDSDEIIGILTNSTVSVQPWYRAVLHFPFCESELYCSTVSDRRRARNHALSPFWKWYGRLCSLVGPRVLGCSGCTIHEQDAEVISFPTRYRAFGAGDIQILGRVL